jgi:hypothetical protein
MVLLLDKGDGIDEVVASGTWGLSTIDAVVAPVLSTSPPSSLLDDTDGANCTLSFSKIGYELF